MEQENIHGRMSVPQFGGWDQNAPGATDYSVVFTQARANKKHQKTSMTEIKTKIHEIEGDSVNSNNSQSHHHHHHHHHHHVRSHAPEDSMGKKRIMAYINCCIKP
ncbi:NEDD8-specific protease 1 [Cajanus cajan]|uniref:NEDD8-specific protease 1 n=1 Tax=Cajanus cajan TaxID=3821 RepID=UPI00098DCD91|nr:NEDD8-specific protease 1 [Cajanus cajan]